MNKNIYIESTTFSNMNDANEVASAIITKKIAACAQIGKEINSTYVWKSKLFSEKEIPVEFKVSINNLKKLEQELKDIHPYECPEFTAVLAEASDDYLKWVNGSCV